MVGVGKSRRVGSPSPRAARRGPAGAAPAAPPPATRRARAVRSAAAPRHDGRGGCAQPRQATTTHGLWSCTSQGRRPSCRPKRSPPRHPAPPPSAAAQARKAPPRRVVPCRRPACSVLPSARRGAMVSQWCPHRPGKLPLLKGAQAAAALWYVGGAACQHTPSALAASRPRRCMRARLAPICLSN